MQAAARLDERIREAWDDDVECGIIDSDDLRDVLSRLGCEEEIDAAMLWDQLAVDEVGVVEFEAMRAWFVAAYGGDASTGVAPESEAEPVGEEPIVEPEAEPEPQVEDDPEAQQQAYGELDQEQSSLMSELDELDSLDGESDGEHVFESADDEMETQAEPYLEPQLKVEGIAARKALISAGVGPMELPKLHQSLEPKPEPELEAESESVELVAEAQSETELLEEEDLTMLYVRRLTQQALGLDIDEAEIEAVSLHPVEDRKKALIELIEKNVREDASTGAAPEAEAKPVGEEPIVESEAEPEAEPKAEPKAEPEPQVEDEPEAEQQPGTGPEPEPEPKPEPEPEPGLGLHLQRLSEGEPPQQSVWQWRGDTAPPKKTRDMWVTYDARLCRSLEQAATLQQDGPVQVDDERYVDLRHMLQRRYDSPSRYREVRRRQVLRSGYMEKKGGEDVRRSDGTLEKRRTKAEGMRRKWETRWVVLFADGELAYYVTGPRKEQQEVLPSCSRDAALQLRSPTGEHCMVDNGRRDGEFIIVMPKIRGKDPKAKTFRLDDVDDRNAWTELIFEKFGSSGTLPLWEDGSQMLATDVVGRIVDVEQPGTEPRRGVVTQFCNTGTRALLSKPTGTISWIRKTTAGQAVQSYVGVTKHVIKFDDTGEDEEVELARENNGKSPFRAATNPTIVQAIASELGSIGAGSRHVALRWKVQDCFRHCNHKWDVELRRAPQDWKPVAVKPPPVDTERSASLFDLGSNSDKPGGMLMAEWRKSSDWSYMDGSSFEADYDWECIVRGLDPSTLYQARVRSVVHEHGSANRSCPPALDPDALAPISSGREIFGAWSEVSDVTTVSDEPPKYDALELPLDGRQEDVSGWWIKECVSNVRVDKGMGIGSRWFRVRRPAQWSDWDGSQVEVLWRVKPHDKAQPWSSTVSVEVMSDPSPDGRHAPNETNRGDSLCGRVRIGAGECVCIESEPTDDAVTDGVMDYAYMVLKPHEFVQQTAPLEGRYVRIEHAYEPLSVVDISVFDASGERVRVAEAAMSSSFCTEEGSAFPASRMADDDIATFCCTQGPDENRRLSWLRVDLGRPVTIGRIEILGRLDDGELSGYKHKNGLADAMVSITNDRMGVPGMRVWNSTPVPAGPKLLCYSWTSCRQHRADHSSPQGARRVREVSAASEMYSKALASDGGTAREGVHTGLEYPEADFKILDSLLEELCPSDSTKLPSKWAVLPGDGVLMPFSTTERATHFRVRKQFTSKAKPFWVQLQNSASAGQCLDVVMKAGDDLRQDQVVLSMLEVFNRIWEDTGVMHTTAGNDRVLVEAPTYRVATVGNTHGFVEMLPNSEPCDDIVEKPGRGENGWKASNEIIPSSVAAFIVIFALNIKDRHKGNMVVTGGTKLANIDFGWLEEGPLLDTGSFPIPDGLQYLLAATNKWAEFHDLAWDSVNVLHENVDSIVDHWCRILRHRKVNDDFLAKEVSQRIKQRLSIDRADLDEQLREKSLSTWAKNLAHSMKISLAAASRNSRASPKPSSPDPEGLVLKQSEPATGQPEPEPEPDPGPGPEPEPETELEPELEPEPEQIDGTVPVESEPKAIASDFNALLRRLDVLEYASVLAEEDIRSEEDLRDLKMDELKDLGFKLGSRKRVLKWANS